MRSNEATPLSSQAAASPSMMHERERRRANVSTISEKRRVRSLPGRLYSRTRGPSFLAITRKPSCLISCNHWPPDGSLSAFVGRHGAMNPAGRVHGRKHRCAAAKCESSGAISWVKGRLLSVRRSRAYRSKHPRASSYPSQRQGPPRDFGTPLSRRPERMPWAGFFVCASTHSRRQFLANAAMAASRVAS
jgi:hypothetical protein